YDGTIFALGARPRDWGGKDAPMVEPHRLAKAGKRAARQRGFAAVAPRLLDQAGLVKELVAVKHLLLVPRAAAGAEAKPHALAPAQCTCGLGFVGAHSPFV